MGRGRTSRVVRKEERGGGPGIRDPRRRSRLCPRLPGVAVVVGRRRRRRVTVRPFRSASVGTRPVGPLVAGLRVVDHSPRPGVVLDRGRVWKRALCETYESVGQTFVAEHSLVFLT